jgi:hypothetical protein
MLVMVTAGGFNRFFEELSAQNKGLPASDLPRTERLMKNYGLSYSGPPPPDFSEISPSPWP